MNNDLIKEITEDYAVNIAIKNGMTEGELANKRLSHDAKILRIDNLKDFISNLEYLGPVKCITRNAGAISIQEGALHNQYLHGYKQINISAEAGLILNPRGVDLRIFFRHWNHVFYIDRPRHDELQKSFQIFNNSGVAICKIYLTVDSDQKVMNSILNKYISEDQAPVAFFGDNCSTAITKRVLPKELAKEVDDAWRKMKEVHDFYLLMNKYKLNRQEIFQCVGEDLAYMVSTSALYEIINLAKEKNEELTIFVANPGCVQIYTGLIGNIFYKGNWLNIFNENNKLHIAHKDIDACWIVRKPGEHGYVTSLEVFSTSGEQMIQIYGQRNEGEPERASWRNIIENVKSAS